MSKHRLGRRPQALPNYAPKVLAVSEQALADGTIRPGQFYSLDVLHDDWCDLLTGKGPCNCDPEVCPPRRVPFPQEN
jgi:hypothetical protein